MFRVLGVRGEDRGSSLRHHVEVLHAGGHVAGGTQVGQADVAALGSAVLVRPVVPRVRRVGT